MCSLCNMNIGGLHVLEDEYHFVLVCPFYSTIRDKYIKPYYYNTPSTFKLTQLMSTDSSKHLIKLCKYFYHIIYKSSNRNKVRDKFGITYFEKLITMQI